MKKYIYILLVSLLPLLSFGQNWKFMRNEFSIGIGASAFLGDLGGANEIGTHFVKDWEFTMTQPAIQLSYYYKFTPNFKLRVNALYGVVSGDDALTEEFARNSRNLNFKSPIIEGDIMVEYYPFQEKTGSRYGSKRAGKKGSSYFSFYLTAGIGGFYFNPQGKDSTGTWHELYDYHTEGQGLTDGPKQYEKLQLNVPIGIGLKYALNRKMSLGFEFVGRITFTDYIDDVSTVYYDKEAIRAAYGDDAAYFSDPNNKGWNNQAGEQRGEPAYNDFYGFMTLSFHYRLLRGRRNNPRF